MMEDNSSRGFNNSDPNKKFIWSDEDKHYLKDNFESQTNTELAENLNKKVAQVLSQLSRQYLTRKRKTN